MVRAGRNHVKLVAQAVTDGGQASRDGVGTWFYPEDFLAALRQLEESGFVLVAEFAEYMTQKKDIGRGWVGWLEFDLEGGRCVK